jgi:hypothetical protein
VRQVRNIVWVCLGAATLAACGGDDASSGGQTAVGRHFDELAQAVAGCADTLAGCNRKAQKSDERNACTNTFRSCRTQAGKDAEEALIDSISECEEWNSSCEQDATTDAAQLRCASSLRTCIGEANAQVKTDSKPDASSGTIAPTYQCFGQLRECVGSAGGPKACAAQARTCVSAAVSPPEPRKLTRPDAGVEDAGL